MSSSPSESPRRRAHIGLADAPLGDYRPADEDQAASASSPAPATPPAPDPRAEPPRLAAETTRSVNFHIPRSLDRRLGRLKYELESKYGVRTSKTALAAAALASLPQDPLAALALLRGYEAAEVDPRDAGPR